MGEARRREYARLVPDCDTAILLTAEGHWMLVTGALMLRRSHTLTERSSDPETMRSELLKEAEVTGSV